jgi:hypothetical protein
MESLSQQMADMANVVKHCDPEQIDLDDVRDLLRTAASYITALEGLLPRSRSFSYRRLGDGVVQIQLKAETDEDSLATILQFLGENLSPRL